MNGGRERAREGTTKTWRSTSRERERERERSGGRESIKERQRGSYIRAHT